MHASRSENSRVSGSASVYLLACVALLAGASVLLGPINRTRSELQLQAHVALAKNLPPDIAVTQAGLGTFRALATSVLWTRATRLQSEGSYFEAMRLADWITRLQPRFSAVWSFQAWNMAFNISLATDLPSERWLWVREGIALLRDRGIPLNPREIDLYQELSHIFLRKLSGPSDEHRLYLQREFARRWQTLLGTPPEGDATQVESWLRPVAEAYERYLTGLESPGNPTESFLRDVPQASHWNEELDAIGIEPGIETLSEIATGAQGRLADWIKRYGYTSEYPRLLAFLRARTLKEDFNMDPRWMLSLVRGDWVGKKESEKIPLRLDWRLPEAHCVYWASLGLHRGRELLRPNEYADFFCGSNLLNALSYLEASGRLVLEKNGEVYRRLPSPEFATSLRRALEVEARKYPEIYPEQQPAPTGPGN